MKLEMAQDSKYSQFLPYFFWNKCRFCWREKFFIFSMHGKMCKIWKGENRKENPLSTTDAAEKLSIYWRSWKGKNKEEKVKVSGGGEISETFQILAI